MALKLIQTLIVGQHRAKVYRDSEWSEYRVRFYHHAEYLGEGQDYHTGDKLDALGTAQSVLWHLAGLLEVRKALQDYAKAQGRTWRASLGALWLSGADTGYLRFARNQLGPDWLNHPNGATATV